jgi:hypothetical protein
MKVLEIHAELGKKKKGDDRPRWRRGRRDVPGRGEAETWPETGMAWLAGTSPMEVRFKT